MLFSVALTPKITKTNTQRKVTKLNVISLIQSIESNEERIEAERLEIEKLLISDGKSSLEQYVSELFACVDLGGRGIIN